MSKKVILYNCTDGDALIGYANQLVLLRQLARLRKLANKQLIYNPEYMLELPYKQLPLVCN